MKVLSGLPRWCEHFIVAIDAVVNRRTLSKETVKSHLIQDEQQVYYYVPMWRLNNSAIVNCTFKPLNSRSAPECSHCRQQVYMVPKCCSDYSQIKAGSWPIVADSQNAFTGSDIDEYVF